MELIHIDPDDIDTPAQEIAKYIKNKLFVNEKLLWLIPGGSAIKVAVRARDLIGDLSADDVLHVALSDERYGNLGHPDSNFRQLTEAGFDTNGLEFHSTLIGEDIETTSQKYNELLQNLINSADVVVALLGMGADGHTAGLLPGNPLMETADFVGYFEASDYLRITITPSLIHRIDEVTLYAVGESKWPVLSELKTTKLPVANLRQVRKLTVFSDYLEEEA